MNSGVSVITCTGNRPEAFALCVMWMERQTYKGDLDWVIVDDGQVPTTDSVATTIPYTVVRPQPFWEPGDNTLARNILAGLDKAKHDIIMFVEDDDWVAPDYIEFTVELLKCCGEEVLAVGSKLSHYYHVVARKHRAIENANHASLGQTAIRRGAVERLKHICDRANRATKIDISFWKSLNDDDAGVRYVTQTDISPVFRLAGGVNSVDMVVGMKGLPGRAGIGIGHQPSFYHRDDPDGSVLREWIGDDARYYRYFTKSKVA